MDDVTNTSSDLVPGGTQSPRAASTAIFNPSNIGERPGDRIGPYKLLSILGEGGFGVVYLAERREPIVQRVALKIIKPGMDSRAVIARFEQERQALAVMDHPNVARVFDAGATPTGRPYFVMEHVQGEPITEYCDRQRLTIKQRLELFIPVCEAVQHAHMKGIIHRDIKPSNILITIKDGHPIPKVIDFGVAKAISHTLTDKTIFTEHGQIIGTPEYMSPEQAEMGAVDIDTRTDVYSLGVVLYELLTGTLPFDSVELRSKGYNEIQRIIRDMEPPRPSTKLTRQSESAAITAKHRQIQIEALVRELRRELEWIPLKAMRKDRSQRYPTANDIADDITRYLHGKPLEAGPQATLYSVKKFIRRHRFGVAASAAVSVAIIAGLLGTIAGLAEARSQRSQATKRADELAAIAAFQTEQLSGIDVALMGERLRTDLHNRAREGLAQTGGDLATTQQSLADFDKAMAGVNFTDAALTSLDANIFDQALRSIDSQFLDHPLVKARLLQTLADTMRALGLTPARHSTARASFGNSPAHAGR